MRIVGMKYALETIPESKVKLNILENQNLKKKN